MDWRENVKYYFPKFETWKYWRTNKNRRANKNVYFSEFYFISTAKLWTSGWKCFVYFVIKGKKVLAIWLFLIKIAKLSRHIELSSSWWSSKIFTVVIRIITRCWIVGVPGLWPAQRPAAWCLVGIILLITIYRSKMWGDLLCIFTSCIS